MFKSLILMYRAFRWAIRVLQHLENDTRHPANHHPQDEDLTAVPPAEGKTTPAQRPPSDTSQERRIVIDDSYFQCGTPTPATNPSLYHESLAHLSLLELTERIRMLAALNEAQQCMSLYYYGATKFEPSKMFWAFMSSVRDTHVAAACTYLLFTEIPKFSPCAGEHAGKWINQLFYEMDDFSFNYLASMEGAIRFVKPTVFRDLIICEKYEKALALFAHGIRTDIKIEASQLHLTRLADGDWHIIRIELKPSPQMDGCDAGEVFTKYLRTRPDGFSQIQKREAILDYELLEFKGISS